MPKTHGSPGETPPDDGRRTKRWTIGHLWTLVLAPLILAVIAGCVPLPFSKDSSGTADTTNAPPLANPDDPPSTPSLEFFSAFPPSAAPSTHPLDPYPPSTPPPPSSGTTEDGADSGPPPGTRLQYLNELDEESHRSVDKRSKNIGGTAYAESVSYGMSHCNPKITFSYPLSGEWSGFTATAGISDDSDPETTVEFTAAVNGAAVENSGPLGRGQKHDFNVPVTSGDKLELTMVITSGNGGMCGDIGDAVWGNARLIP